MLMIGKEESFMFRNDEENLKQVVREFDHEKRFIRNQKNKTRRDSDSDVHNKINSTVGGPSVDGITTNGNSVVVGGGSSDNLLRSLRGITSEHGNRATENSVNKFMGSADLSGNNDSG